MSLAELNVELKEDMALLEKEYSKLIQAYMEMIFIPQTIHSNLRLMSLMCSEQIKAQRGEKSFQCKFETTEDFAKYLGMMIDIYIGDLEKKYNIKPYIKGE